MQRLSNQWLLRGSLALLCWMPDAAWAQSNVVSLAYKVPSELDDCPRVDEFQAMVSRRLGRAPVLVGPQREVEVSVHSEPTGLKGTIRWNQLPDKSQEQRQIDSSARDCRRLMAAMAFVLAVQIELMAGEESEEPEEDAASEATAVAPAPSSESRQPLAKVPQTPDAPLILAAGLGPSVGVGIAPDVSVLGRGFVSLRLDSASVELGVEGNPWIRSRLEDGQGFRQQILLATLAGCWHLQDLSACGFTKIGALRVTGEGVDQPASSAGAVVQAGPRLAYLIRIGDPLGLLVHLDANYLLSPWSVTLDGANVWTMPRVSAVAGIDLVARFR